MKYKDDLDEAHHTIEKLRKTQNVAEKYRKKLEGMGELERQIKTLEEQNAQMLQDLQAGADNSKQVPGLKRTLEQYKKQIEKLEAECADALRAKHGIEVEKNILKEKTAGAESQKSKDMERIQNLEEKIRELESGVISRATEEVNGDLNSELTFTTKTKTDLCVESVRKRWFNKQADKETGNYKLHD
jgi:chromosome segregation ATPase